MTLHKLALAVVVLFLFAAGAQALDPCTLVSKADVQLTVGQTVAGPTPNKANAAVCDFKVGDFGGLGFPALQQRPGETPRQDYRGTEEGEDPGDRSEGDRRPCLFREIRGMG